MADWVHSEIESGCILETFDQNFDYDSLRPLLNFTIIIIITYNFYSLFIFVLISLARGCCPNPELELLPWLIRDLHSLK